jgi:hypothetical protein
VNQVRADGNPEMVLGVAATGSRGVGVRDVVLPVQPPRPWPEQVLPYGLAEMMLITPSRWTLTEVSRGVRLPAE